MTDPIVIIGANAAGVSAALALREHGYDGQVVLLSAEKCLPYERPAVSKGILQNSAAPLIVPEAMYAERHIDLRLGARAARIDCATATVDVIDGERMYPLRASRILLATGGRARKLAIPGGHLPGVHYARTADDAHGIREGLQPGARVLIVGGGLIGAEVASTAVVAGCDVTWIEAGYRCLTRALASPLSQIMMEIHAARGVRIVTQATVTRVLGSDRATGIELADGRRFDADLIVVGVGIEPAAELAQAAGAFVANGVVVDGSCATSLANVYAAGDVAFHRTSHMSDPGRLEHWQHAQKQGACAARAMLGMEASFDELPWFWTDQYQHHIEGCGLPREDDQVVVRGSADDGGLTAFYLRSGNLVAAITLNRSNDVRASMRLIARGLTPDRSALQDESVDLRKLERSMHREVA